MTKTYLLFMLIRKKNHNRIYVLLEGVMEDEHREK